MSPEDVLEAINESEIGDLVRSIQSEVECAESAEEASDMIASLLAARKAAIKLIAEIDGFTWMPKAKR